MSRYGRQYIDPEPQIINTGVVVEFLERRQMFRMAEWVKVTATYRDTHGPLIDKLSRRIYELELKLSKHEPPPPPYRSTVTWTGD